MWVPHQALGGHYGPVVDMCWALHGACLFTASEDQTARIFSEFQGGWCEIARPQVCLTVHVCLCCTSRAWLIDGRMQMLGWLLAGGPDAGSSMHLHG